MDKRISLFFFLILSVLGKPDIFAQSDGSWYLLEFKDKGTEITIRDSFTKLLSKRALERRNNQQIPFDALDRPVYKGYLRDLEALGFRWFHPSKWLNSVVVTGDVSSISKMESLSYVRAVSYLGRIKQKNRPKQQAKTQKQLPEKDSAYYGLLTPAVNLLNGSFLHQNGYRGKNILITMLDAGYKGLNHWQGIKQLPMIGQNNLIHPHAPITRYSDHGTAVLGLMAMDQPGRYVGTAPDASFHCLITEMDRGEQLLEDYLWAVGVEYADSLGADIIVSSLGYGHFPKKQRRYSGKSLDGATSFSSRAASIAARKGLLVIVSAGNSDRKWNQITFPADAKGILAVGAVDLNGRPSSFSARGPTGDGRTKPDLVAPGEALPIWTESGLALRQGYGTSYAAPLVAGLAACLMQAYPDASVDDLIQAIKKTASHASKPDNLVGYGIPNFKKAFLFLQKRNAATIKSPGG